MTAAGSAGAAHGPRALFGHPYGLYVLSLTEMWERFSYYGMRSLLVFYLTQKLLFTDAAAFQLYGNYTALVFATPLLGGLLADRLLGFRKAVVLGGWLMVAGHLGLAAHELPQWAHAAAGPASAVAALLASEQAFYLSLALLIAGVGLFKPNVSSMVGQLYPPGSVLRDSGFTIFVCGINIGAASAALVCGYLGQTYGWAYGFGAAALGVGAGLAVLGGGRRHLAGIGLPPPAPRPGWSGRLPVPHALLWSIPVALVVVASWRMVQMPASLGYVITVAFLVVTAGSLAYVLTRNDRPEKRRLMGAFVLMTSWILSVALIEQEGSSIALFTERLVDRDLSLPAFATGVPGSAPGAGAEINGGVLQLRAAQLQAVSPILIILGAPLVAWLWSSLARRGVAPSAPFKFGLSFIVLAAGYGLLALGTLWPNEDGRVGLMWLLLFAGCIAAGCLLVIPVGLAAVSRLAAPRLAGAMMGLWLFSNSVGNYLSAWVAAWSTRAASGSPATTLATTASSFQGFFVSLAAAALVIGLVLLVASPRLSRWMDDAP